MLKYIVILSLLVVITVGSACQHQGQATPYEVNQSEFLPVLRQASMPFADFFDKEIKPLDAEIHWFYDPHTPLGVPAYTQMSSNGRFANIYLSHIPVPEDGDASLKEDAFTIAHELASLVIAPTFQEGWYLSCEDLGLYAPLDSMITVPLRDTILGEYGFDVQEEFDYITGLLEQTNCSESYNLSVIHESAFDYVLSALYWQKVLGNNGISPVIDNIYQQCRPNARIEGLNILAIVNEIGYDTPDKARALLDRIISECSLDCHTELSGQAR